MDDCKLVFRYLSQFFHGRWFISNQAEAATPMSVLQRLLPVNDRSYTSASRQ